MQISFDLSVKIISVHYEIFTSNIPDLYYCNMLYSGGDCSSFFPRVCNFLPYFFATSQILCYGFFCHSLDYIRFNYIRSKMNCNRSRNISRRDSMHCVSTTDTKSGVARQGLIFITVGF
jgi:hypothetical protein